MEEDPRPCPAFIGVQMNVQAHAPICTTLNHISYLMVASTSVDLLLQKQ